MDVDSNETDFLYLYVFLLRDLLPSSSSEYLGMIALLCYASFRMIPRLDLPL